MGSVPSGKSHVKWDNSNGAADFLQLIQSGGSILGWIDSNGIPQGALAIGGGAPPSSFSGITGGTNTGALVVGSGGSLSATGSGTITATNGGGAFSSYIDVVAQFGVIADAKWAVDATFSTSATSCGSASVPAGTCVAITATDPPFACPGGIYPCTSGGDVGKLALGTYNCSDANPGACATTFTDGTIVKVIDATHAQLSKAVSFSSANSGSVGSNFAWGSAGNGAKLQAAVNFMVANPGTAIALPCGTSGGGTTGGAGAIMFDTTPFSIGFHAYPIGIYGCPNGGTILIPSTANFTNGFLVSSFEIGAFHTQPGSQDQFANLFFWGLGVDSGAGESHFVLEFSGASLNNVNVAGWLWNEVNTFSITGLYCNNNCTLVNSGSYCGGNFPCQIGSGFFSTTMTGGICGGSNSVGMTITGASTPGSSVTIKGAYLYGSTGSNRYGVLVTSSNPVVLEANNIAGISVTGSAAVVLKGNYIDYFFGAAANMISNAGGTISIEGNFFHPVGTPLLNQSSGTLIDNCGNQGMSGSVTVSGGTIIGPCSNSGGNPWGVVTNCNSSASPAACGSASQGSVAVPAGSSTLVVDTTAVTANSQIILTEDASLGTKLGVTCNGTPSVQPLTVTARTAATSFTFSNTSPSSNPRCVSYQIIN